MTSKKVIIFKSKEMCLFVQKEEFLKDSFLMSSGRSKRYSESVVGVYHKSSVRVPKISAV